MKSKIISSSVLLALAFAGVASAQTSGSGTIGVTATVQGSILMTFSTNGSGLAMTGTTTSTGSLPFGNVSMFGGTVPANVTKTLTGVASFALSTPFNIRVDLANSASTSFTLSATLSQADAVNVWEISTVDVSSGNSTTINATADYVTPAAYTLKVTVPASASAGLITNTLNFVATAN